MNLIIFRKDGKIHSIQAVPGETEKTPALIKSFNETHSDTQAELHELTELETYLYENRNAKISNFKQDLRDIYHAVQNLDTSLGWLENVCKEDEY